MNKPISLLCWICLLPLLATAQEARGRWSFGLYAQPGYTFSNTLYASDNTFAARERFVGLAGGIRGRDGVAPKLAMGMGIGYAYRQDASAPTALSGLLGNRFQLRDMEVPILSYIPLGNTEEHFSLLSVPERTQAGGQLLARPCQPTGSKWLFGQGVHTNMGRYSLLNRNNVPGYTLGWQTIYSLPLGK